MANRRQFLEMGLALSAVASPLLTTRRAEAGGTDPEALRIERFVFDNRFAEAVAVARHATREGMRLAETSGDLTDLWYEDLDGRWKTAPETLAGITSARGLFVLETLAADRRMRVVYRGEHGVAANGRIEHVLSGPAGVVALAAAPGEPGWECALARALVRCPAGRAPAHTISLAAQSMPPSTRAEPLFSWIIAPRSSAAPLT